MEQKQVKLIGLNVKNNGIIQAATLTPDVLSKRLVVITGETGNGKSTLLNAAKIATCGTDFVKKKDALPVGFEDEALLMDGDVKIYIGLKVSQYQRGEKSGEPKVETYLYTKDNNGRPVQPIIDGVAWTAAEYWKALTTELTHSLSDLFSENQTVHRKLIEKLFKPELDRLGADAVVERILEAKKKRDNARTFCQANGAFLERFEDEGYTERSLESITRIDVGELDKAITAAIIERDRMLNGPESAYKLACNELEQAKADKLRSIKEEGVVIRAEIDALKAKFTQEYEDKRSLYNQQESDIYHLTENYGILKDMVMQFIGCEDVKIVRDEQGKVIAVSGNEILIKLDEVFEKKLSALSTLTEPVMEPIPAELLAKLDSKLKEYQAEESKPIQYPEKGVVSTEQVDAKIKGLEEQKKSADSVNKMFDRYQLWKSWIEAKGLYEKEVDTLRKLYASIDTGVPGMRIEPQDTEAGRVEVWIKYNGEYDSSYFCNESKESRFMFEYSSFQRTVIGLMLQSARLNLKPKALRLAYIDDVAFTARDLDVLSTIAEELDLTLIIAWTQEADKNHLFDGQVLVEGGEAFFNAR